MNETDILEMESGSMKTGVFHPQSKSVKPSQTNAACF